MPINFRYPLTKGTRDTFDANYDLNNSVKENIKHVIMTMPGERIFMPEYGCGVIKLLYEPINANTKNKVKTEIEGAINRWVPNVTSVNVTVKERTDLTENELTIVPLDYNSIVASISYIVKISSNVSTIRQAVSFLLSPPR